MEKQREDKKNSFQNIIAVFSVACLAKVSGKLYQFIMKFLIQGLINFFKFKLKSFSESYSVSLS